MIPTVDYPEDIQNTVEDLGRLLGNPIDMSKMKVVDRGQPHRWEALPEGHYGIFIFLWGDNVLKIGHAEWNRRMWFGYQQYSSKLVSRTLASALMKDKNMKCYHLESETLSRWMMESLRRIDILIDESVGLLTVELIDKALNYRYSPRYENTGLQSEAYGVWQVHLVDRAILIEKDRETLYPWEHGKNI